MAKTGMTKSERRLTLAAENILRDGLSGEDMAEALGRLRAAFKAWEDELSHDFSRVSWTAEDIVGLNPAWSQDEAEAFLSENESAVENAMTKAGWAVLENEFLSLGEGEGAAS